MCENLRKVTTYRHTVSQSWRWCRRSANHCGSEACYWYCRSLGDGPFMVEFLHTPEIGDVLMGIGAMQCQASTLVPNLCSHAASQVVWVFQLASRTCLSSSRLLLRGATSCNAKCVQRSLCRRLAGSIKETRMAAATNVPWCHDSSGFLLRDSCRVWLFPGWTITCLWNTLNIPSEDRPDLLQKLWFLHISRTTEVDSLFRRRSLSSYFQSTLTWGSPVLRALRWPKLTHWMSICCLGLEPSRPLLLHFVSQKLVRPVFKVKILFFWDNSFSFAIF